MPIIGVPAKPVSRGEKAGEVMTGRNWTKIKNEYISTNISQRKLADKHGVAFQTLRDRASKENWAAARDAQRNKIGTKTVQKTAEKLADAAADYAVDIAALNALAAKAALDMTRRVHEPRDLKALTGAIKDIADIKKALDAAAGGGDGSLGLLAGFAKIIKDGNYDDDA